MVTRGCDSRWVMSLCVGRITLVVICRCARVAFECVLWAVARAALGLRDGQLPVSAKGLARGVSGSAGGSAA